MSASCKCGNNTFDEPERDYYGGAWIFTCAECGSSLVVNEDMSE